MKVMWLCNTPTINVAEAYNLPQPAQGGWLVSVSEALEKNETIEFLFVLPNVKSIEGIAYTEKNGSLYIAMNTVSMDDSAAICAFEDILRKTEPDIIHIWGTEYRHSYAMAMAAKNLSMSKQVVVSIQGLVGMIAQHYMGGIPASYQLFPSIRDILRRDTLRKQQKNLKQRVKL